MAPDKVVIVSHGQPGDPGPQQQAIEDLADSVARLDPGIAVRGATLAMPGALEIADANSLIYPMFMAEGWFTGRQLPQRLAQIGVAQATIMRPFGTDPALPGLIVAKAHAAARARDWQPARTTLLLSAHGSQRSQASYTITTALAERVAPHFAGVVTGFVEQPPFIASAARGLGCAVSLPLFALRAEHVLDDLPQALDEAGFSGPRLDPIGLAPEVPGMIAAAIRRFLAGSR